MMDLIPESLAQDFWTGTGLSESFPRDIEQAIAMKLPLALVKIPLLKASSVHRWLEHRSIVAELPDDQRDLMGCLVAHRGHGIVFVCNADEPGEQRLTVAHETAHFITDYLLPRRHVIQALGEKIVDVLDGHRRATPLERADAILSHVRLGAHVHLLPRHGTDDDSDISVACAEDRADQLALELVAPKEQIIRLLKKLSARKAMNSDKMCSELAAYFGLPAHAFQPIAHKVGQRRPISFLTDAITAIRNQQ